MRMILAVKVKKCARVFPIRLALIAEPEIQLMNKFRRLQCVIGALPAEVAIGDPPEIRINQWKKFVHRTGAAFLPFS